MIARVPCTGGNRFSYTFNIGVITDFDGKFTLNIPSDAKTITISFVGLVSKEITIGNNSNFTVVLTESNIGGGGSCSSWI